MLQLAIRLSQDNASVIATSLDDYSAQDLLDELLMLNQDSAVLVMMANRRGVFVSHVVTESMFWANATTVTGTINKETPTEVVQL